MAQGKKVVEIDGTTKTEYIVEDDKLYINRTDANHDQVVMDAAKLRNSISNKTSISNYGDEFMAAYIPWQVYLANFSDKEYRHGDQLYKTKRMLEFLKQHPEYRTTPKL